MQNVDFSHIVPLSLNNTNATSAVHCNELCLSAKSAGALRDGNSGLPLACSLWRYCSGPSGCKRSSPDTYFNCQLQNYFTLDKGFSEEPLTQLGGPRSNFTDDGTFYGTPRIICPQVYAVILQGFKAHVVRRCTDYVHSCRNPNAAGVCAVSLSALP